MELYDVKSFGKRLKSLRKLNGLSLIQVSINVHIDPAVLSKIENGHRTATKDQVLNFCHFYKCSKDDLMSLWLSDKFLEEIENKEIGIHTIELLKDKLQKIN